MKLLYKIYTFFKYYPGRNIRKYFIFRGEKPKIDYDGKYKKILFCPFAPHRINIIREAIWAHSCSLRGADVKMISYDLFLPAIDFISPKVKKDLKVSYSHVRRLYQLTGLNATYLSEYLDNIEFPNSDNLSPDEIVSLEFDGIVLGDLVTASTIRYFYSNGPEWENPVFLKKARDFAYSALLLTRIFILLLKKEQPDKLVFSHGIYVSWGTLFRVARHLGIPVDIYGSSYRKDTLRFYHNAPNAPFPEGEWKKFENKDLSSEELEIVDEYIKSRSTQSEDSVSLFSEHDNFPEELQSFLENAAESSAKLFGLFSNISWDAYMFRNSNTSFENMVEWVNDNIKYFSKRKDAFVIIKAHPSEDYFDVPEKYRLKNCISKDLPDNILFLNEKANVKPEILYKYLDIGLIYTSTVSLEMALKKIPVISAGSGGHYSNKGFTLDPENKTEYFDFIEKLNSGELTYNPDTDMAKKYLYFRFFREALKNNLLRVEKYNIKEYYFTSANDLLPGRDKSLDIICDGILKGTSFIN